jgi:hypothetical protein
VDGYDYEVDADRLDQADDGHRLVSPDLIHGDQVAKFMHDFYERALRGPADILR